MYEINSNANLKDYSILFYLDKIHRYIIHRTLYVTYLDKIIYHY